MRTKTTLIALAMLSLFSLTTEKAYAWGCVAVASDGAYGYSYNWASEEDAELTALNQCDAKSATGDCETDSCDPDL